MKLTHSDLVAVARAAGGRELPTIGGRAKFTVDVKAGRSGATLTCTPASTMKPRAISSDADRVLARFNETGSMRSSDYTDITVNSVYFLALIKRATERLGAGPADRVQ